MLKHCPTCNRTTETTRFIGERCEVCLSSELAKRMPSHATVSYCKRCGRLKTPEGHEERSKASLSRALKKELCGKGCDIEVKAFDGEVADVVFTQSVDDSSVSFGKRIAVSMHHEICTTCYRRSSGYYEAIVQIRGDMYRAEKLAGTIHKYVEKNGSFVSKIDRFENGIDIYAGDKKMLQEFFMARKLKPKTSYTLYTINGGRRVYRNTYLIRLG